MLPLRHLCCAAWATVALSCAPIAVADEFDWLYFPMYLNDTAHAVHLKSLKFRPDGLLAAATRYPRTPDDWSGPEARHGWYNYDERLIDCETGYMVETSGALLDRHHTKLLSRPTTRAEQVKRLSTQLERPHEWPVQNDIFLACAAASNAAFQRRRGAAAAKVQPLFSDRSLIELLSAETQDLVAAPMLYDFERIARRPAAPAAALFDDMRAQHTAWRAGFNAGHVAAAANTTTDREVLAAVDRHLMKSGMGNLVVTKIEGDIVEHTYPKEPTIGRFKPGNRSPGMMEKVRSHCDAAISVPIAKHHVSLGKPPRDTPLRVKDVLPAIRARYQAPQGLEGGAAIVCRELDSVRHERALQTVAVAAPDALQPPYGLNPTALATYATPEAMLLAIRAARRSALRAAKIEIPDLTDR